MDFNEYQAKARKFAIYPKDNILYPVLGLASETGEVADKFKKCIRDNNSDFNDIDFKESVKKELGDIIWYLGNIASDLGICLDDIAVTNINKLQFRKERGKLQGSGDDR